MPDTVGWTGGCENVEPAPSQRAAAVVTSFLISALTNGSKGKIDSLSVYKK